MLSHSRLRGHVLRADGSPASGALVAVVSGDAPTPEIGVRSDGEGRFDLALPSGRFVVEAYDGSGQSGRATVNVGFGDEAVEILIRFGKFS